MTARKKPPVTIIKKPDPKDIGSWLKCHACGARSNAVTPVEGHARPEPGALIICERCGTPNILTDAPSFRAWTEEERMMYLSDAVAARLIREGQRRARAKKSANPFNIIQ